MVLGGTNILKQGGIGDPPTWLFLRGFFSQQTKKKQKTGEISTREIQKKGGGGTKTMGEEEGKRVYGLGGGTFLERKVGVENRGGERKILKREKKGGGGERIKKMFFYP